MQPKHFLLFLLLIPFGLWGQNIENDTLSAKKLLRSAAQYKNNPEKALSASLEAAQLYQTHQQWAAYTKAILMSVSILRSKKQSQEALSLLETAQKNIGDKDVEGKRLRAKLLYEAAKIKDFQGDYLAATADYKTVLASYIKHYGADAKELIPIYNNLGEINLLAKLEKPLEAFNFYQQALDLSLKHHGAESSITGGYYIQISHCHRMMGKFELAETFEDKALAIFKKNGNKGGESSVLMSKGNSYNRKKEYEKALEMYKASTALMEKNPSVDAFSLSNGYGNIGSIYMTLGNHEEALKYMTKKYEANKRIFPKHHPKNARVGRNMVSIYLALNRFEDALKMADESFIAATVDYEGVINMEQLKALVEKENFLNPVVTGGAITNYTEIYSSLYEQNGDLASLQQAALALDAFSSFNTQNFRVFSSDVEQIEFRNRVLYPTLQLGVWIYHELYKKTQDKKYIHQAFDLVELNKNTLLNASLQADEAAKFGEIPDSLVLKEKQLGQKIGKIEQALIDARTRKAEDKIQQLTNQLSRLRLQKNEFIASLEKQYPKYYDFKFKITLANIESIQAKLTDNETCLLEYFEGQRFFYVFKIDKENVDLIALPRPKKFNQELRLFRQALSDFSFIFGQKELAYKNFATIGHHFYQSLLAEVLTSDKKYKRLIIIPDGELGHIPFEALLTKPAPDKQDSYQDLDYLLKSYVISYSYSGTLHLKNLSQTQSVSNGKMLAFAAEYKDLGAVTAVVRSPIHRQVRQALAPLPAAREEVAALEKYFDGAFKFGAAANEKEFKTLAPQYAIIHLAMHGILDKQNPTLSNLAFTENGDSTEDNFLHAYELSNMNLNAALVVLSACETGYGKFQKGEGIMSLARSFMYAGTPSLLVSLWQVNDNATSLIMQSFYKNLAKGMDKATALQQAKLDYMGDGDGIAAHPAFWAPFVQLGDDSPIIPEMKSSMLNYAYLGGAALFLLGLGLFVRGRMTRKEH